MSHEPKAPFVFVIDTDSYAGNFERDLCAYITGCIGDCGVGQGMAELYDKEVGVEPFTNPFEDIIVSEPDEHGCHRPATIYGTPGTFGNGLGGSFKDGQEAESLAHYKAVAASIYGQYAEAPRNHLKMLAGDDENAKAELKRLGWTVAACQEAIAEQEQKIAEAQVLTKTPKYPGAYNSVAISFEKRPTKEQISLMKERAYRFAAMMTDWVCEPRIKTITGFRLIKQTIKRDAQEESV